MLTSRPLRKESDRVDAEFESATETENQKQNIVAFNEAVLSRLSPTDTLSLQN